MKRDGADTITFTGKIIGDVTARDGRALVALRIYQSVDGDYVCARRSYSDVTTYEGAVCKNAAEVAEFFGTGNLAVEVLTDAGLYAGE